MSDRYMIISRYCVLYYVPLHKLLAIACWAHGVNPAILFEGVNHLGLVTLKSSQSSVNLKMRIIANT
jgi:hypothetical protein